MFFVLRLSIETSYKNLKISKIILKFRVIHLLSMIKRFFLTLEYFSEKPVKNLLKTGKILEKLPVNISRFLKMCDLGGFFAVFCLNNLFFSGFVMFLLDIMLCSIALFFKRGCADELNTLNVQY